MTVAGRLPKIITFEESNHMSWKWEELTAHDFPAAVATARQTCIVAVGVLEKHGEHLPTGTDTLNSRAIAERAAEIEPAIVFPWYYFGQIHEAKQWPGAVALRREVLHAVLENVCEEIARNGMNKIVLLNGHGGNESWLDSFSLFLLERPRPYTVYLVRLRDYYTLDALPEWQKQMQSTFDHHAGEFETSLSLAVRPDLVKMEYVTEPGLPQKRLGALAGMAKTTMFWYAEYPTHYAGDATHATAEKGRFIFDRQAARVAEILRAVKNDTITPAMEAEYFARCQH
jgi:creatinine amidohydrolase